MKSIAFIDAGTLRPPIVQSRLHLAENEKLDWSLFIQWLHKIGDPFDTHYYDAMPDEPSSGLKSFHSMLQQELNLQLHFTPLRSKRKHCPHCHTQYTIDEQKGVDVMIALHMYKLAASYDQAILVSGDGDFGEIARMLREDCGRRVMVIGWEDGIAPQLRSAVNKVVHIEDYRNHIIVNQ